MSILVESFEDHYYTHAISLKHMESAKKRRVLGFLQTMEQDILSQMEGRGLQFQGSIAGVNREARLNAMLHQIRETISTNYDELKKDSREFLNDFVSMETMDQVDLMNSSIRMPLYNVVMTQNAIETIVDKSLIRGAVMSNWWDRQKDNTQNRIITQIQLGFAEGEGIGDLRRRIIGKATGKWQQIIVNGQKRRVYERVGGIVDISKREADALVRTAIQTLSGRVRDRIYEQNDDIVDQVESVATLDARTTPLCASYDNLRWTQKSHSPVGHSKMYYATPRHWNCRSTHIPVMVELERLEKQAREAGIDIPPSMRASMDGPQPAMRSMDDWLKSKPPEFQRQVIGGKRKMEMFNEGKISLRDLTDDQGRVKTLRELMQPLSAPDGLPYAIARKPVIAEVYDSFRRNILQEPGVSLESVRPKGGLPAPVVTRPDIPPVITKSPTSLERDHIEKTKVSGFGTGYMAEGINETQMLTNDFDIVFKPMSGESPNLRIGIPQGTYYRREVAASVIDEELGLGLVPTTGIKNIVDPTKQTRILKLNDRLNGLIQDQSRLERRIKLAYSKNGKQSLWDSGAIEDMFDESHLFAFDWDKNIKIVESNLDELSEIYRKYKLQEAQGIRFGISELEKQIKKLELPNIGSAQKFIHGYDIVKDNPSMSGTNQDWLSVANQQQLEGMNLFDYIIFNTDRHNGNWMVKTKQTYFDSKNNVELTPSQRKKLLSIDDWNDQKREWIEDGIDPIDRLYDKVDGWKGKTMFGGDYDEYLTEQGIKMQMSDVDIALIDNGLSLPQIDVSMGDLVRDNQVKAIFQDKAISPYWMNKLEDFLSRESQIRSRLDPLELDLDSLGQGKTLDLMFDRVRQLVQKKTHFDPKRPGEIQLGPGSFFEKRKIRNTELDAIRKEIRAEELGTIETDTRARSLIQRINDLNENPNASKMITVEELRLTTIPPKPKRKKRRKKRKRKVEAS